MDEQKREREHLQQIVTEIDDQLQKLKQSTSGLKSDVVSIRKHFWDDVTVNLDDPDDAIETAAAIKQQAEVLADRERGYQQAHKQITTLERLKMSPYFGRIDFVEDGETETERVYIGIASLRDESGEQFYIYDWRAPVSSMYYDYAPGPAEYDTPGGLVKGEMLLKRQFIIRDGKLESMFDTGVTIGDELLQAVLGKQADNRMKSIVATIQKEQNRIIRNEKSKLLIVQGAAGSGKTSAALQRVAYLLYRYRNTLRADHILLFSPNAMFTSYISTVLPELGEENMQQSTFQQYLHHRLGEDFDLEEPFDQLEYVLTERGSSDYEARMEGIRFKASEQFMQLLDQYALQLGEQGIVFHDMKLKGEVIISGEDIGAYFYSLDRSMRLPNRVSLTEEWLLDQLRQAAKKEINKDWVQDEIEYLDIEDYADSYQSLRSKNRFTENTFDDEQRERRYLAKKVVQRHFKPLRKFVKQLQFIDTPSIYRALFANNDMANKLIDDVPKQWERICEQTIQKLDAKQLCYEDATPYLYLKEKLTGFQTNRTIRHVFIDEAQDYSPFQMLYLRRIFPSSKMTVLGDLNQSIYAHAAFGSGIEALKRSFQEDDHTEQLVLTRSYRSTQPIVEFTRAIVAGAGGDQIEPFERKGPKPTVTFVADQAHIAREMLRRIDQLTSEGHDTIAIICKSAQESAEAYRMLSREREDLPVRLIKKETSSFEAGIQVVPSYLAKGVEFDAVIVYNASQEQYGDESERKLFYTVCTRAMHELHLLYTGKLTSFVSALPETLYESETTVMQPENR